GRVCAVLHADPLFKQGIGKCICPDRCRSFQPKPLNQFESFGSHGTVRPAASVQIIVAPVILNGFLQVRYQQGAPERRFQRCEKQTVIAACLHAGDSPRCESTNAIRHQPFAFFRYRQITANFAAELDCGLRQELHGNFFTNHNDIWLRHRFPPNWSCAVQATDHSSPVRCNTTNVSSSTTGVPPRNNRSTEFNWNAAALGDSVARSPATASSPSRPRKSSLAFRDSVIPSVYIISMSSGAKRTAC